MTCYSGPFKVLLLLHLQSVHGEVDLALRQVRVDPHGHAVSHRDENERMEHFMRMRELPRGAQLMDHMAFSNPTAELFQAVPVTDGLKCGVSISHPATTCPEACPYMARDNITQCQFQCLKKLACGTLDSMATIPDEKQMICRRCAIAGCADCKVGTKESCNKCEPGYLLLDNGRCQGAFFYVVLGVKILVGILFVAVSAILIDILTREQTNWKGYRTGTTFRWRTRLHMAADTPEEQGVMDLPDDEQDETTQELLLYPLSTSLRQEPGLAGGGLCLHFNWFTAVLTWSAVIIFAYAILACAVSTDLLMLGLKPAKTAAQLCTVVQWGHDVQMRLVWVKTSFIGFVYGFSFLGAIYLGIYQHKEFHRLDDAVTMGDFAAWIIGLPVLKGSDRAEDELAKFVGETTGQQVRGVSICWNYTQYKDDVDKANEADWKEREERLNPPVPEDPENPAPRQPKLGFIRRQFRKVDCLLGFEMPKDPEEGDPDPADAAPLLPEGSAPAQAQDIITILNSMESSDCAFVVFETEEARNAAVEDFEARKVAGQPVEYKGCNITMLKKKCEPESVKFDGLCYGSWSWFRVIKVMQGIFITILFLGIWVGAFYVPYAYFMMSFSYANGEKPDLFTSMLFTMLVVGGNQGMYLLADILAQRAMFGFEDDREKAYNFVYVTACVLNTICDLGVVITLSYFTMVGRGAHTDDGRLLSELTDFGEIFQSYPIQKMFGEMLQAYAFPCCFLIPFCLEGICTIFVPKVLFGRILLSHDEVQGRDAELTMVYFLPMNMGRYGDILLNIILCTMVFFAPGGFTLPMFVAFLLCHMYVYVYDHCRILRCTPSFCYASTDVDDFGQLQLILPTGILAACLVLRLAQMYPTALTGQGYGPIKGPLLWSILAGAFCLHCLLHFVCLKYLVPCFEPPPHQAATETYAEVAKGRPSTWFSANPVHCLRSKYIFKDNPPNIFCAPGKQHLQKANPKAGAYFEASNKQRAKTGKGAP